MVWIRHTVAIDRTELARISLSHVRLWPGCETVVSIAVLSMPPDRFALRVIEYGMTPVKLADRALRAIEREALRYYHLKAN